MLRAIFLRVLILIGGVAPVALSGCSAAHASLAASVTTAPALQSTQLKEIHVDQSCHILPDLTIDPAICHLESVLTSEHPEETIRDGVTSDTTVYIREQEYLLGNVTAKPVVFVVEQPVPEGWTIDSDPKPAETRGTTAIFRVNADPGQVVRLHVGMRHAVPIGDVSAPSTPN